MGVSRATYIAASLQLHRRPGLEDGQQRHELCVRIRRGPTASVHHIARPSIRSL